MQSSEYEAGFGVSCKLLLYKEIACDEILDGWSYVAKILCT